MVDKTVSRRVFVAAGAVALPFLALRPLTGRTIRDKVICSIYPDGAPWDVPVGGSVEAAQTAEPALLSRRELTGEFCKPFKSTHEILPPGEPGTSNTSVDGEADTQSAADSPVRSRALDKTKREVGKSVLAVAIVLGCASAAR